MSFSAENFESVAIQDLARRRGIIEGDETIGNALNRVHASIVEIDERLEDNQDPLFAADLAATFVNNTALPGTPILTNAGRNKSTVAAYTVVHAPKGGVGELLRRSEAALRAGVGTGYDLSDSQDPVSDLEHLNEWLFRLDQQLVQQKRRPVASMVTLNSRHPDVLQFINAKVGADFSRWRANISVVFRGDEANSDFKSLVFPIAQAAHRCGEPGVLFFDRFDADNPTPDISYVSTAPCAEVALAAGELCHFWYVNLDEMVVEADTALDWERLRRTVGIVVRALDAAVQMSIDSGAAKVVNAKRRIGVGVAGFHSLLMRLGIPYCSDAAEALARRLSEWITFSAHGASADLVARRGPFPAWHGSRFRDMAWLQRKAAHRTGVINDEDWQHLNHRIAETGIRHASVVAYPPSGMTSELLGTSKSYEPFFMLTGQSQPDQLTGQHRKTISAGVEQALSRLHPDFAAKSSQLLLDAQSRGMLSDASERSLFATARQISVDSHLRIHAAFQRFADESGAKTVNVPKNADLDTIVRLFQSARELGLKGITVFRDGCLEKYSARPTLRSELT